MKAYWSVSEVADRFGVTDAAVRDWIAKRKLIAIQPSGENGAYRIPAAAVEVLAQRRAGMVRASTGPVQVGSPVDLYAERIGPVLAETGLTAEELLRRMADDTDLAIRYRSFPSDYAAYVDSLTRGAEASADDAARVAGD